MIPTNTNDTSDHSECQALGQLLALIGDKWTVMVVGALSRGPLRFNELRRQIDGISQRMLTLTLRRLESEALLVRTVYPSVPPKVEYRLSDEGHTLILPLSALADWAATHRVRRLQGGVSGTARANGQNPRAVTRSP
ncbi:MAG: helix-turn-helix domain-containing protein [Porticoccaceae bacterium]